MQNDPIYIDPKSLDRLNMNFDRFQVEFFQEAKNGLANLGAKIVASAQSNLKKKKLVGKISTGSVKRSNSIASGALINSGSVKEMADLVIQAGFPMKYAYYVEFGRRAGGYPPFREIYEWVRKKHLPYWDDKEARSLAFAIRKTIGDKGTKPAPFLRPAFEKHKKGVEQFIAKAVRKVMNKDYAR